MHITLHASGNANATKVSIFHFFAFLPFHRSFYLFLDIVCLIMYRDSSNAIIGGTAKRVRCLSEMLATLHASGNVNATKVSIFHFFAFLPFPPLSISFWACLIMYRDST